MIINTYCFYSWCWFKNEIWEPQIDAFDNNVLAYDLLDMVKHPSKKNISFDDFSKQLINLINELNLKKFI